MSSQQPIEDIYPLSPMQQGMLFHLLYQPDAGLNVLQMSCVLQGELDVAAFRRALGRVIERHAVLRTSFVWEEVDEPLQIVDCEVPVPLAVQDWSGLAEEQQRQRLEAYLADDVARGFDLTQAPLMRVLLARETPDRHRLVWSLQMILFDGWSLPAVIGEVLVHYEAFRAGDDPRLATPRHFRDYIAWLQQRDAGEAERFWRRELAGFTAPTPLPGDRGPGRRPAMTQQRLQLTAEETAALQALARRERLTLNTILQGAWALLLARSGGTADVVFGATVSGRPPDLPGVETMIGLFINTLPVRARFDLKADRAADPVAWLRKLQERQAEARQHEHTPLVDVQGWSDVPRGLTLFDSIVVFENYPVAEAVGGRRGTLGIDEIRVLDANSYPLTVEVHPGARLSVRLTCDGARFTARAAEALLSQLARILRALGGERAPASLGALFGPTEEERRQVLTEWNHAETGFDVELPLHRLFELAADRAPRATAVVSGGLRQTYEELERRANRLAHHLRRLGVGPEERVGLCAERSPGMIEGILGILKAGGAYVPLDPDVPAERLDYLLADSGIRVLVAQEEVLPRLTLPPGPVVVPLAGPEIGAESDARPAGGVGPADPENAAYVIYTSGSTGRPKGVVVTHANVARLLAATRDWFAFGPDDVWTLFHSFAFDFSVWEIWGALAYGGRLVIVPYLASRSPADFLTLLAAEGVTVLNQTPSAFRQLVQALPLDTTPGLALRWVVFGGEALETHALLPWFGRFGDERPRLVNMYGITETTVHVTYRPLAAADLEGGSVVGVPIPDLQVYLVDAALGLVPPWAPGEICVGGAGVARGYLGRPELTAERFLPDPWGPRPGSRLYRSGDLARGLPWGDLEYLGRIDQQVKIRGFRIEPGEIEAALAAHPALRDSAVVARDAGGERRLVAYVVPWDGSSPSALELRAFLSGRLPEYMVPSAFVPLPALPLTANGKLDRRALPAPDPAAVQDGAEHVPPETPAERTLAAIWADVLGLERVGARDNFFALGGDSIRSIQVLARAAEQGIELSLPQIFQHQTVRELARVVGGGGEAGGVPAPFSLLNPAERERLSEVLGEVLGGEPEELLEDAYPLARLQAGMLYHGELAPGSAVYHDIFGTHVEAPFDEALLRRAFATMVALHPVLRTSFDLTSFSAPLQLVHRKVEPHLAIDDLRGTELEAQERFLAEWMEAEKAQPVPLDRAPLLHVRIFRRSDASFQLTLSFHHAILDGWSVATLMSETFGLYLALCRGEETPVTAPPPGAFARFVALEQRALASEESRAFWRERLAGVETTLLPRWLPQSAERRLGPASWPVAVAPSVGEGVRRLARALGVPVKSVLLAAHCRALAALSGQTDVVTGVVVNGRPEEEGGERALGLFLNTLPLRLALPGGTWGELVRQAFEAEAGLLAHRRFPVAELQRWSAGPASPLFEAVFNFVHFHVYQGLSRFDEIRSLGGQFYEETNFDFLAGFEQDPFTGGVRLRLQLEAGRFPAVHAAAVTRAYELALAELAAGDGSGRYDLGSPLSAAERHQLAVEWNDTASDYPGDAGLAALFARQARRSPGAPAVRYGADELTYGELDERANRLARHLRALGVGRGTPVAVAVERSAAMVVATLAVIKAGGAYVPLDPADPAERLAWLLADSGAPVLVVGDAPPAGIGAAGVRVVSLAADAAATPEIRERLGHPLPPVATDGADLGYLMYTSGSTGRPKGAAIPQRAIARLVLGTGYVAFGPGRRIGQAAPTSFDASTFEIWGALLNGGTVVGVPREVALAPEAFETAVAELGIDILFLTTSLFNRIARERPRAFVSIGQLVVGGEALDPARIREVLAEAPPGRLVNGYGPTETTTFAVCHRITEVPPDAVSIPLGQPIANSRAHVLDALGAGAAAIGVPGELALGGDGLAWGYHRRPELTAERFVPDPFDDLRGESGGRLYRTGDLARRRPGGLIEYLGRIDQQVKLRGFRIEPGEVETALGAHPGVRAAAVMVAEAGPGDRRLVAYVVVAPNPATSRPAPAELRGWLEERLPEHMVPAAFVTLDAFPLTASGKIDRRALPPVVWEEGVAVAGYVAPRNGFEEMLAGIWAAVLGLERVGVHDDFFVLGGHSLLATQVISRVRAAFSIDLPLRALFDEPTVAGLAAVVEAEVRGGLVAAPPLLPVPRDGGATTAGLPLSFSQERLWFLYRLDPASTAYNMPVAVRLAGPLDRVALERAVREIVRRHEALRTTFREIDGEAVQVIAPAPETRMPLVDLSALPERAEAEALRLASEDAGRPFELERGPLFRPFLLRIAPADHVVSATMHHIVSDGWSLEVFVREVTALYATFGAGLASPLPALPVQYADYAVWQRRWLDGEALERELGFWREELRGLPPLLELPADRPRPEMQSGRGGFFTRELGAGTAAALPALARELGATPFMVALAAFTGFLGRHAGTEDLAVGVPVSGRSRQEVEDLIGFFVNSLVIRADLGGDPPFAELVRRTRERSLAAQAHQAVPFEKLVEELQPERDLGRSPLFQVMFSYETGTTRDGARAAEASVAQPVELERRAAQFDFSLSLQEIGAGLLGGWEYAADLFDDGTARRLADRFQILLAGALAQPRARLSDLPLLTAAEREQVLHEWNGQAVPSLAGTLVERFAERVRLTPEAPAVISPAEQGSERLSFADLAAWADRLALRLRRLGVGPETVVAVLLERSAAAVAAMLGVLRAGGAWLPLDPVYPAVRVAWLLADSGARALITRQGLLADLPPDLPPVVLVDEPGPEDGADGEVGPEIGPSNLAYVIYTSGSTGLPKGVGVEHGAATDHLTAMAGEYGFGPGERVLWFSSPGFDASVEQVVPALLAGAAVVPRGDELWSPDDLLAVFGRLDVTAVDLPPAYWQQWVREQPDAPRGALRLVNVAGEAMPAEAARRWGRTPMGGAELINGYGPTEAVVTATFFRVPPDWEPLPGAAVPLGRPLPFRTAYVLDPYGQPQPVGVPGELCLGGLLARGYLGRPALTAERFVPDPWSAVPGGRLYRTGDLVRWLRGFPDDGLLDFLGRVDRQVKIRGVRIEPGEVEAALTAHPDVRQAVVVARDGVQGIELVAYIVVVPRGEVPEGLRELLRERLPEAMVPSAIVPLPELPLTPSGKIDRRALPAPDRASRVARRAGEGTAPRTRVEQRLAAIWREVLGLDRVAIEDGFFDLGGHSLLATRVVSRIRNAFGVHLPLRRLFETPTIAGLAEWVEGQIGAVGAASRLVPVARTGEALPLSFAQRRLWFLYQLDPATTAYNMPLVLRLSGHVEPALLAAILGAVVERHEALRTVFQVPVQEGSQGGEEPVQVVLPPAPFPLPLADLSVLPETARADEMRRRIDLEVARPFDLEHGPVLRGLLLRLAPRDQVLVFTLHHIAGDAWSCRVLMREMTTLCLAAAAGRPPRLPELPVQYADYAVWQRSWLEGDVLAEQLAYWRNQLTGAPALLELPMERPRPAVQTVAGAAEFRALDDELSAALHGLARREGATPFMVLLAGFAALLGRYSSQTDVVVGSPIAGRNRQELEGLIGFFLNTLALRTGLAGDPSFRALLGRVRETTLGAYTHQDIPFEHLLEELRPERSLAHTPLFQVMINWDNSGEAGRPAPVVLPDFSIEVLTAGEAVAKFDLELYIRELGRELGDRLELQLVYNRDLFGREAMAALLGHLDTLLAGAMAAPERHLSELALAPEQARQVVVVPSTAESLTARFFRQAAAGPDRPAVWTPEGSWIYRDLRSAVERVAHALGSLCGRGEERVALLFTPGAPMIAAVLGTLAAGKTYVPLDPSYPLERLRAVLGDCAAVALLAGGVVDSEGTAALAGDLPVLAFDGLPSVPAGWLPPPVAPETLAYLLYTSGSTGEPKGVFQSHRNVLHHVETYAARLEIAPGDRLTLLPSYGFDASVMDLFGALLAGAELSLWDVRARGAEGLADWIREREITVYHSTPTFFRHFLESLPAGERLPSVRAVVLGGEAVRPHDLDLFQRFFSPGCRLVNGLGPTESTLALQAVYDHGSWVDRASLPVGLPVEGTEVLLWNAAGRQVAVWGTGEIVLRGPYLAHGYWRRPELTAAAFGPDPEGGGGRVYRTGDLGRLLPGGALEFVGRRDLQVKIRGVRVEPAEVEAVLARHPDVQENAVVSLEGRALEPWGEPRLAAYVAVRAGQSLSAAGLRSYLGERLPAAMVPAAFVFLPSLPWTATGKLDRRALPAPAAGPEGAGERVAPRDAVEQALAAIWSELLGIREIGVHDSFFDLGGHSLLITRVLARIQASFGVTPPLRDLFADPTIAGIAAAIAREKESAAPAAGMKLSAVPRRGRKARREDLDRES